MRRTLSKAALTTLPLALLALARCSHAPRPPEAAGSTPAAAAPDPVTQLAPAADGELIIATTTDFHGNFAQAEGLAATIGSLRRRFGDHLVLLDGGNLFHGSLAANLSKGRASVALFNKLGLDASAVGNHDFDYGPDAEGRTYVKAGEDGMGNLKARAKEAGFYWLSANLVAKARSKAPPRSKTNALGQETIFRAHAVLKRLGKKVCVIGATTPEARRITNPDFLRDAHLDPLDKVVAAEARQLRKSEGCDFVVLLAHSGIICDEQGQCASKDRRNEIPALLKRLPRHALDAVVAGHADALTQTVIKGTPVIEAGSGGYQVGILRLQGASHKFEPFLPVSEGASGPEVDAINETLRPFDEQATAAGKRELGEASRSFIPLYGLENALGNLTADALLEAGKSAGATAALVNAAALRGPLLSGRISFASLFSAFPYDNALAILKLTGSELERLLSIAYSGERGLPSVAGLRIRRLTTPGAGKAAVEVRDAEGRRLSPGQTYTLATLDYLASGSEGLGAVLDRVPTSRKQVLEGPVVRDRIAEYITARSPLDPDRYFDPEQPRIEGASRPRKRSAE